MAITGLTTLTPDEIAPFERPILVTTPDGSYEVIHFKTGQVIAGEVFWWGVVRTSEVWPEVYSTSLEDAMGWLARRLLQTCF